MVRDARTAALLRAAMQEESRSLRQGMQNTSSDYLSEYPRLMYRATPDAETAVQSTDRNGQPREVFEINRYAGLLCETLVAETPDEAEALTADGWDVTPQAAHGVVSGLATATTAKDDEIAALRAQIAALQDAAAAEPEPEPEPERRGPGRPRKEPIAADSGL